MQKYLHKLTDKPTYEHRGFDRSFSCLIWIIDKVKRRISNLLFWQIDAKKFSVTINIYFGIIWNETRMDITVVCIIIISSRSLLSFLQKAKHVCKRIYVQLGVYFANHVFATLIIHGIIIMIKIISVIFSFLTKLILKSIFSTESPRIHSCPWTWPSLATLATGEHRHWFRDDGDRDRDRVDHDGDRDDAGGFDVWYGDRQAWVPNIFIYNLVSFSPLVCLEVATNISKKCSNKYFLSKKCGNKYFLSKKCGNKYFL